MFLKALLTIFIVQLALAEQQLWEKDASEEVYIEGSREGFERVDLKCNEKFMKISVKMEEDFDGIFYTR